MSALSKRETKELNLPHRKLMLKKIFKKLSKTPLSSIKILLLV